MLSAFIRRNSCWVYWAVLFAFIGMVESASAVDLEVLGGAEVDSRSQGYRYLGAGLRHRLDDHWTILARVTGSGLRYEFEAEGQTLHAHAVAVTPSIGMQHRRGTLTAGILIGEDFRKTKRARVNAPQETEHDTGIFLQAEIDYWFGGLNDIFLIASYAGVDQYFWNRIRIKRQITNQAFLKPVSWFLGGEGVGSGNNDFNSFQLGGLLERHHRLLHLSWTLKGGYKHTSTESFLIYGGFEFYISY